MSTKGVLESWEPVISLLVADCRGLEGFWGISVSLRNELSNAADRIRTEEVAANRAHRIRPPQHRNSITNIEILS